MPRRELLMDTLVFLSVVIESSGVSHGESHSVEHHHEQV